MSVSTNHAFAIRMPCAHCGEMTPTVCPKCRHGFFVCSQTCYAATKTDHDRVCKGNDDIQHAVPPIALLRRDLSVLREIYVLGRLILKYGNHKDLFLSVLEISSTRPPSEVVVLDTTSVSRFMSPADGASLRGRMAKLSPGQVMLVYATAWYAYFVVIPVAAPTNI